MNVRNEAVAIHLLLVTFPGTKVEHALRQVEEEVMVLARMRRPPKPKRKGIE